MDWNELLTLLAKGEEAALEELKKSAVSATSIGIGGGLTPAAARKYFTTVTDQSSFLGRVTSEQVEALQQDVDLFAVSDRQLKRVPEGSEPTPEQETGASNLGKRWALKDVQMFPTILFSTLINRQKQGNVEAYLAALFAKVFRNDLLLLGLIGDESSGDDFTALNDGWAKLARAAVDGTSRDLANVGGQMVRHGAVATQRLNHGAVTGGPFTAGETVTGGTSSATGKVAEVGSGFLLVYAVTGTFAAAEELTGSSSSATADTTTLGSVITTFAAGETVTGATSDATGKVIQVGGGYLSLSAVSGTFEADEVLTGAISGAKAASTVLGSVDLDHMATMDAMLQQMHDKYLNEAKTCFVMSKKGAIAWGKQMAENDGLNPYLITGKVPRYQGYEVIGVPNWAANTKLLTDPKNLGFGMGSTIKRYREIRARKRAIDYTWELYSDYLIINDEAVVYSD